jgi:hypothetical protein
MTGVDEDDTWTAREAVVVARRDAAMAQARLAEAAVRYADARIAGDTAAAVGSGRCSRAKPGEFVADELALMSRGQPYQVCCLVARARRMAAALPTVWEAFRRGEVDADQIRVIDRVARRVTETATLAAIDEQAVDAAHTRSPKQLQVWLLRLVVQLEPLAFAHRHCRALAERRVTVVQGTDGMGYVTGEVSAVDAAAIDALLAATSRSLGTEDPRTDQQRRADLFADLLLGRITFDNQPEDEDGKNDEEEEEENETADDQDVAEHSGESADEADDHDVAEGSGASAEEGDDQVSTGAGASAEEAGDPDVPSASAVSGGWLEVEDIDPDTGELLGTHLQRLDADGQPTGEPVDPTSAITAGVKPSVGPRVIKRPRTIRIGVVVPLASLLDASETPGELADRSGFIPGDALKNQISEALTSNAGIRCCSPGCLPTTAADSWMSPNSAAAHQPGSPPPSTSGPAAAASPPAPCPPTGATWITTNHCRTAKPPAETWTRSAADTTAAKPSPGMPPTETMTASTGPCPTPNTTDASTNHYPPDKARSSALSRPAAR